jgi:signal peptide peptidase SppA
MSILQALNAPWAIQPEMLLTIHEIAARHARGEQGDIEALEARLGRPVANEQRRYTVERGVAVVPMVGVLAKRMNMFMQISGGSSMQLMARDLAMALDDDEAHSVVLMIDSPGGTVDGTEQLASAVLAGRDRKRIVALADGGMCSAAYWIGSAASNVYAADSVTQVGSIGVVQKHVDVSGAEAKEGIRTTEITAGKFKRSASMYGPLTDAGRQTLQDDVDYVYALFVEAVAKHRGVSEEKVLQDMADGRVFRGRQAVAAGLIDGITSLDALITDLNKSRPSSRGTRASAQPPSGEATMPQTVDQIRAESPDAANALIALGAEQERARIQGIENATLPGHEALIASLKFDGKTSPGDAALAVMAAERKKLSAQAQANAEEAPEPVRTAATPAVDPKKVEKTDQQKADEVSALAAKEGIDPLLAAQRLGYAG